MNDDGSAGRDVEVVETGRLRVAVVAGALHLQAPTVGSIIAKDLAVHQAANSGERMGDNQPTYFESDMPSGAPVSAAVFNPEDGTHMTHLDRVTPVAFDPMASTSLAGLTDQICNLPLLERDVDGRTALFRIGDVVPTFKRVDFGSRMEFDEFVLVVGKGRNERFWQTVCAQGEQVIERRIDPVAALIGVDAYLDYVNAALIEIGSNDDCGEQTSTGAADAETDSTGSAADEDHDFVPPTSMIKDQPRPAA